MFWRSFLSGNPWQYINNNKTWGNGATLIKELAGDIYQLVSKVGIGIIACSMLILILKWALYKNQEGALNRRNVLFGPLLFKLILVSTITCLPYLIGELWRIVNLIAASMVK